GARGRAHLLFLPTRRSSVLLLQLAQRQRAGGVITASGGNHGLALAYAAHRLGQRATVYLPATASEDREARIATWGARVIRYGARSEEHTSELQSPDHLVCRR